MPALPSVPKVLRIALKQVLDEDTDVLNRLFFQYSGSAPTNTELDTLAVSIFTSWGSDIATQLSDHIALQEVSIEDLSSPTSSIGSATGSTPGTGTGGRVAAGTALVIKQLIARRYRGGHPRIYIAGMESANLQDSQTWNSSTVTTMATQWAAFASAIEGAVWSGGGTLVPVNVSYYEGFTPFLYPSGRYKNRPNLRATPLIDPVAGYVVNPKVGSQRRRNLQSS